MELLDKHEKWRSWLVGFSKAFRSKWKKTKDDEAEEKWQILSDYQERLKNAFGDIIEQSEYLISEYSSCGVDWFYQDVLQNCKPSQCVKDCADIVYYEKPQDEKYKGTFLLRLASLIYKKFGFVDGRIYPEHPEPLPENAEQWQVDDWKEEMDDACSGIVWEEKLECDWLVVYVLIFAFYAALKNEEVLFLVKEGEEAELNGGKLTEAAAPTPAVKEKKTREEKWKDDKLTLAQKRKEWEKDVFTHRANVSFNAAIKKNWIKEKPYGFEWTPPFVKDVKSKQELVCFFIGIYEDDGRRPPYTKLKIMFREEANLSDLAAKLRGTEKQNPVIWYKEVTDLRKRKERNGQAWYTEQTKDMLRRIPGLPPWYLDIFDFFSIINSRLS